jgi:exosortase/archaeosortase family protein
VGYQVYQAQPTELMLDNFELNVAVPCSGLKLLVAVTAFTVFFMLIARLRWWANAIMLASVLPLCLFINGLRIGLIGIVGEESGRAAGLAFHDYSGYITLLVCFFILFKFARVLGWKD